VTIGSPRLHTWQARDVGWQDDFIIEDYRGTLASVMARSDSASEPQAVYRYVHTGSSPFNIVCMANSYGDAAPTFDTADGVARTVLGCWVRRSSTDGGPYSIPDVTHTDSLLHASQALDHFRELGEHDLELNYGIGGSLYWDNAGGTANDWGGVANWSAVGGGGASPAALPGVSDVAAFSATPIQGAAQTVNLNADRSVQGLNVLSGVTASTTLLGGGTNRALTLGDAGIVNAASTALTIGSDTAGQQVAVTLAGNQCIAADGSGGITLANNVSGTGTPTLTNNGTGSGYVGMGALQSSVGKIVQDSATSTLGLRANNNLFTGNVEILKGKVLIGTSANNLGSSAGQVNLGSSALGATAAATLEINDNQNITYAAKPIVLGTTSGALKIVLRDSGGAVYTHTLTGGITGDNALTLETQGGDDKLTFSTGALNNAGTITHIGTGAGDLTINAAIGANVTGVIQNSATSRLVLNGANTYTGDTTVSAGVLAVNGTAIPNFGKLVVQSGGKVGIASGTENVGTLFFGAVQQVAGTWGSTSSTAANKDDTYFTGAGLVSVATGPGSPPPPPPSGPFKLLFSCQQDLVDAWGEVDVVVTPSDSISTNAPESAMNSASMSPPRWPVACFPLPDGSWEVYSQCYTTLNTAWPSTSRWSLLRDTTTDGVTFSNVETVIPETEGTWTSHQTIAYNPDADEYMMLKMDVDPRGTPPNDSNGFVYHAWFSSDGRQWQKYPGTRPRGGLFYEADAMSVFWSPVLKRHVLVSKSLQAWTKRIPDHGGNKRRVLMIRSSPDGRTWTPDGDLKNIFGLNPSQPDDFHPDEWLTVPDAEDPPDLELYSGSAFWYHDRAYMSVLNYAPSPMKPNQHGDHPDYEWWTSSDGLNWERPARGVQANRAIGIGRRDLGPMIIGGKLMWLYWQYQAGMPEDRISGVSARANGEFSTRLFTMPDRDLRLNAMVPSPDRPWVRRSPQPYLMVEVRNAQGGVIPGFERSKCVIWDGTTSPTRDTQVDTTDLLLTWNGVSARQLSGQNIQIRFSFGGSTIYAVTATETGN